jgi:nucleoside phosphorylase
MIRLVVALDCEARPLLRHYRLKIDNTAAGFRVYRNDHMALIVAGMGCTAAAAATAYLQAFLNDGTQRPWLNIGIGGQRNYALGDGYIAHKITAAGSRQCWYPPLVFELPCASAAVHTVDQPETAYPDEAIYEMEAAGFYPTACRFSSAELVQVVKIISDNQIHLPIKLNASVIEQLVAEKLALIEQVISRLSELGRELDTWYREPAGYRQLLERWRFSESERHQLHDRLQRWQLLCPHEALPLTAFASGKDILSWLEQRLATLPVRIVPQKPAAAS